MSANAAGMLWLTRPEDKVERKLDDAVEYAEQKYGCAVQSIQHPIGESYPYTWRGILLEPSQYVLACHLYLVLDWAVVPPPRSVVSLPRSVANGAPAEEIA